MILERLFIENYKQLREPVELFPPEGAIGIVGANGAGKSTLFESILWAFFGSRGGGPRFANESIPWSGGSTKDPTTVEVTLATDGGSFTVRRRLKSGSTSAEALDAQGRTVVSGTADVTRWVEENLLGMDRTAFEATFYARQKELRFFAHDEGISRVRKISRLLGISSVETAQSFLREDRNTLRSEARLLEGRLAEANLDALQTELENASKECQRLEDRAGEGLRRARAAEEELKEAAEARAALEAHVPRTLAPHVRPARAQRLTGGGPKTGQRRPRKTWQSWPGRGGNRTPAAPERRALPEVGPSWKSSKKTGGGRSGETQNRREHFQAQKRIGGHRVRGVGHARRAGRRNRTRSLARMVGPLRAGRTRPPLRDPRGAGNCRRRADGAEERYEELREAACGHEELGLLSEKSSEAAERHEAALAEAAGARGRARGRLRRRGPGETGAGSCAKRRRSCGSWRPITGGGPTPTSARRRTWTRRGRPSTAAPRSTAPPATGGSRAGSRRRSPTPCTGRRPPSGVSPPARPRRPKSSPAPPTTPAQKLEKSHCEHEPLARDARDDRPRRGPRRRAARSAREGQERNRGARGPHRRLGAPDRSGPRRRPAPCASACGICATPVRTSSAWPANTPTGRNAPRSWWRS